MPRKKYGGFYPKPDSYYREPKSRFAGERRRHRKGQPFQWGPLPVIADREWGLANALRLMNMIYDYRRDWDIPMAHVAEQMGVAQSIIARLESRRLDPRLSTVLRYLKVLGLDIEIVKIGGEEAA